MALAGCSNDKLSSVADYTVQTVGPKNHEVRVETTAVEETFPSRQTAEFMQVRLVDPKTGVQLNNSTYAFNGTTEGRAFEGALAGAILPAAIGAAGSIGSTLLLKPSNMNIEGVAVSGSTSSSSSTSSNTTQVSFY